MRHKAQRQYSNWIWAAAFAFAPLTVMAASPQKLLSLCSTQFQSADDAVSAFAEIDFLPFKAEQIEEIAALDQSYSFAVNALQMGDGTEFADIEPSAQFYQGVFNRGLDRNIAVVSEILGASDDNAENPLIFSNGTDFFFLRFGRQGSGGCQYYGASEMPLDVRMWIRDSTAATNKSGGSVISYKLSDGTATVIEVVKPKFEEVFHGFTLPLNYVIRTNRKVSQ